MLAFSECIQDIKGFHCPYPPVWVAGGIVSSCKRQAATGFKGIMLLKFCETAEFLLYI